VQGLCRRFGRLEGGAMGTCGGGGGKWGERGKEEAMFNLGGRRAPATIRYTYLKNEG